MLTDKQAAFLDPNGFPKALSFKGIDEVMNSERFDFLKHALCDSKYFLETIAFMSENDINLFIDIIKGLIGDIKVLYNTIEKLKHLAKGFLTISPKAGSHEVFAKNIELLCEVLNCDRGSIFLHDKIKNTLWSVHAKGGKPIEIPTNVGIAGSVFTSGKPTKIEDAYLDKRFNKAMDLKTGYRTKSILCVPIWDDRNDIIGVCQAINSKNGSFSYDDEKFIDYLAMQAGNSLVRALEYKERDIAFELMKRVVDANSRMCRVNTQSDFLRTIEECAKKVFSTDTVLAYIINQENLYRCENGNIVKKLPLCGIIKSCIIMNKITEDKHCLSNPDFNALVDIDTNCSVKSVPIYSEDKKQVILAFELLNKKGNLRVDKDIVNYFIDVATVGLKSLEDKGINFPVIPPLEN